MRKFILTSLILGTTTLAVLTGCKKDDSSSGSGGGGSSKSTTDMITGGNTRKWKQVSETVNGTPVTQDPCDNDDRAIFTKSGNAFTLDFGTMHCDSDETNLTGTWALSNSDKTLTLNVTYMGVPFPITMDIMSVSDSKLVTREISQ